MGTATTKISIEYIRSVLGIPADCDIVVAPENEDGCLTLIVSHDSIPEDATKVEMIVRQEIFQHVDIRFGHFITAEEAAEAVNGVNSLETPDLPPAYA